MGRRRSTCTTLAPILTTSPAQSPPMRQGSRAMTAWPVEGACHCWASKTQAEGTNWSLPSVGATPSTRLMNTASGTHHPPDPGGHSSASGSPGEPGEQCPSTGSLTISSTHCQLTAPGMTSRCSTTLGWSRQEMCTLFHISDWQAAWKASTLLMGLPMATTLLRSPTARLRTASHSICGRPGASSMTTSRRGLW